jgi:UDPglucose 6-dehydrogenase
MLMEEGCSIRAFDPAAMQRAEQILPPRPNFQYAVDPYDAATDVDALLILTDWAEFGRLDLQRLAATMRYPIVLDGRNLYDPELMLENEITYFSVGRPTRHHTPELAAVASRSR